jgi:S-adenosylmethionine synthetase
VNPERQLLQEVTDMDEPQTTIAEWVLPGHPDKLCDALADRIVGEVLRVDVYGQCGIEAACAFDRVFVTGLIGFERSRLPDIDARLADWVRATYRSAGYGGRWDPAPEALRVELGALRIESRGSEWQELRHLSDDQCICVGYAQDTPQTGYLPGALWTARRIAEALHARQRADPQGPVGPDGKVIVRGEEREDGSFRAQSVSVSLHHAEDADWLALRRHAEAALRDALGATGIVALPELTVNAAGMFLCGGPSGDNGTTGKKLVMDAYGPGVPIGGGALSGKDFHKPDRVGAMLARRMALQCVQAGLGRRVRVQLEYRPNSALPESVHVWADGRRVLLPPAAQPVPTREAARSMIADLAAADFLPLTAGGLARWGHFGSGRWWWEPAAARRATSAAEAPAAAMA